MCNLYFAVILGIWTFSTSFANSQFCILLLYISSPCLEYILHSLYLKIGPLWHFYFLWKVKFVDLFTFSRVKYCFNFAMLFNIHVIFQKNFYVEINYTRLFVTASKTKIIWMDSNDIWTEELNNKSKLIVYIFYITNPQLHVTKKLFH